MDEDVVSLSEYAVPLGRRFRALKLWATLRCFGREGLQAIIREHVRLAELFESWVGSEPGGRSARRVLLARVLSQGRERRRQSDAENQAIMQRVNDSGEIFLSHTRLAGRLVLRLAIGNARTTEADVALAWDVLAARGRLGDGPGDQRRRGEGCRQAFDRRDVTFDRDRLEIAEDDERIELGRRAGDDRLGVLDHTADDGAPVE